MTCDRRPSLLHWPVRILVHHLLNCFQTALCHSNFRHLWADVADYHVRFLDDSRHYLVEKVQAWSPRDKPLCVAGVAAADAAAAAAAAAVVAFQQLFHASARLW
mmetsp:Transcript_71099/g.133005  ORF Transcript_71099/g.133005 Transcript_71099/m.133005 type:complete len:104 (-) Transcript_71099:461-772(-)